MHAAIIQSRCLSVFGHIARTDDDADAKMILTAPPPETGRDHQGVLVSCGWTPFSVIWEPTTSHWTKQSTWPRTVLWCLRMALRTPSGASQKKRRRCMLLSLDLLFSLCCFVWNQQWTNVWEPGQQFLIVGRWRVSFCLYTTQQTASRCNSTKHSALCPAVPPRWLLLPSQRSR